MPSDKNVFFVVLAWIHFHGWVNFVYETAQKKSGSKSTSMGTKKKTKKKNQNNSQQGYSIKRASKIELFSFVLVK